MLIDLSLSLPVDHPIFKMAAEADHSSPISMGHVGTHLDTYLQRPIPLEWMDRRGLLIDVRNYGLNVDLSAIADININPGDFVIFYTGFMEKHPYGTKEYFKEHPQLDWELVQKLVALKVSFIGIDAAGLRHGSKLGDDHHKVDLFCETEGHCYVIENLTNLGELAAVAPKGFSLRLGWIAHKGASGIPVKVVAQVH